MPYLIADGYGVALASLVAIDPQPEGMPVAPVFRGYAASGVVHDQGGVAVWNWSALESEAMFLAVLTQLGLHNAESNEMTIYTRSNRMVWTRYNAIATLPEMGNDAKWDNYFPRQIVARFTHLVALVEP